MKQLIRTVQANLTHADLALFLMLFIGSLAAFPAVGLRFSQADEAIVSVDGKPVYVLKFSHDTEIEIDAPLGPVTVRVRNGRIRVVRSSCPDKFCVAQRPVTPFGGVIVCAPNRLVIQVRRDRVSDLDCVTQ